MITMPVELYTDGSCIRNPGPGGYGYIIRYWETAEGSTLPQSKDIEFSQGYRLTTNNRMEMMAVISGLEKIFTMSDNGGILEKVAQVNIFSDSEYMCKPINQGWLKRWCENNWMTSGFKNKQPTPVKNKDLWEKILGVQQTAQNMGIIITFSWLKGHDGNEYNERCDKLAYDAGNGTTLIMDEEYEKSLIANRR